MRFKTSVLWFCLSATALTAWSAEGSGRAAKGAGKQAAVDTLALHRLYMEGDLDVLIQRIESLIDDGPGPQSPEESLFIHKYLAVAYAKYPEKRELAKYHMLRLLDGRPDANLYDMSASDEVYAIFDRVKAEREARLGLAPSATPGNPGVGGPGADTKAGGGNAAPGVAARSASSSDRPGSDGAGASHSRLYWLGGLAAIGVGAGLAVYLWPDPEPKVVTRTALIDN